MRRSCLTVPTGILTGIVSAAIFYNASTEDQHDMPFKLLMLVLCLLLGANEYFEMKDHITYQDHADTETPLIMNYGTIANETPKKSGGNKRHIIITAIISPLVLPAFYGLFTQNVSLMKSLGVNRHKKYGAAIPTTLISWVRFSAIPGAHAIKNIWHDHEEFTARVIGADKLINPIRSVSSRALIFIILCATHLAESFLLSSEIDESWIYICSIITLSMGRSVAHLDHVDGFSNVLATWRALSSKARCRLTVTGTLSGIAHALPAIIAMASFWKKTSPFVRGAMSLATLIEGLQGALEHAQHAGRRVITASSADTISMSGNVLNL